jgi:hypothetical protein
MIDEPTPLISTLPDAAVSPSEDAAVTVLGDNIKIVCLHGTCQYVVKNGSSEYSFTKEEEARQFAQELAEKQAIFRTSSFDRTADTSGFQPVAETPHKKKTFRLPWNR